MSEMQPMPTFHEKDVETVTSRLQEVRTSLANIEQQLEEAHATYKATTAEDKRAELETLIGDLDEARAHLQDEEFELSDENAEHPNADQMAA